MDGRLSMSTLSDATDAALAAERADWATQVASLTAAARLSDKAAAGWQALLNDSEAQVAALKAQVAALTPTPDPWTVVHTFDLSKDEGWSYTKGVRNTDQSYNQKANATFSKDGLLITATRASSSATIYSADVLGQFAPMPNDFAIEADVTLTGMGSGMFPAFWARPASVDSLGELDFFEYCGKYVGAKYEMKSNVIQTGTSPYLVAQDPIDIPKASFTGGFEGKHTWRVEKVGTTITTFLDGVKVTTHDLSKYPTAQFGNAAKTWYPRFTFQVGNGTGSTAAGVIPSTWLKSTMLVSRLVTYKPTA